MGSGIVVVVLFVIFVGMIAIVSSNISENDSLPTKSIPVKPLKSDPVSIHVTTCSSDSILKNGVCVSNSTPVSKTNDHEKQTEDEIHRLVNVERKKHGLPPLFYDEKLTNIAKSHSEDMFERGYFSHRTPEGKDATDRGEIVGYSCRKMVGNLIYTGIAENIFNQKSTSLPLWKAPWVIAQETVSGWMDSPGHRKNILNDVYQKEGIGVKIDTFGIYVTQNFC